MKKTLLLIEKAFDLIEPITDIVIIVISLLIPFILDIGSMSDKILQTDMGVFDLFIYNIFRYGNIAISICLCLFCFHKIREKNVTKIINKNNNYHIHTYCTYFICAKLLNYGTCKLSKMPIPMIFKLVVNNTFNNYLYLDDIHDTDDDKVKAMLFLNNKFVKYNSVLLNKNKTKTLNIIISDTYDINIKNDVLVNLPQSEIDNSTIIEIKRINNGDCLKYKSLEILKLFSSIINNKSGITKINIFATTNPYNTYKIASECFSLVKRKSVETLYVYYQDGYKNNWKFNNKKEKIL